MRYARSFRRVGLGGLLALGLAAIPAAPAGATLVCPPGTTNPIYCAHRITLTVTLTVSGGQIHLTITVTDPQLKVTLFRNGRYVRTLYWNPHATGTIPLSFPKPKHPRKSAIKVTAVSGGGSRTVVKRFEGKKKKS